MKRVYRAVRIAAGDGGFAVELDGRAAKSPARRPLLVPARGLAVAIAAEWDAQVVEVDPRSMPLTRLASSALDVVAVRHAEVAAEIAGYGATDLVCHRSERPPELVLRQESAWQPLVDWAMRALDAPLLVTRGVVPVAQPEAALHALRRAVERLDSWRLTALASASHAAGSVIVGLALAARRIDAEQAWRASQVDETFEIEQWGADAESTVRRAALRDELIQARRFLDLVEG
ncbi:MAG: ATP12 family protein [Alphaproteobacteria bacterium]